MIRYTIGASLAFVALGAAAYGAEPAARPIQQLLEIIGPQTIVIVPDNPSEQETLSAWSIAEAVAAAQKQDDKDAEPDLTRILLSASKIAPGPARTAENKAAHFISVGKINSMFLHTGLTFSFWAKATPAENKLYVYGFGDFTGNVGYIESGRNPYPFTETETVKPYRNWIRISGLTDKGVKLAADAFLNRGILNGVITDNEQVPEGMLPDKHAFPGGCLRKSDTPPSLAPLKVANARLVGWTQPNETVYLGLMEMIDLPESPQRLMPVRMWRAEYFLPSGPEGLFDSLHRIGTERELLLAQFARPSEAKEALERLRRARSSDRWVKKGDVWVGRRVSARVSGQWLILSDPKLGPGAL